MNLFFHLSVETGTCAYCCHIELSYFRPFLQLRYILLNFTPASSICMVSVIIMSSTNGVTLFYPPSSLLTTALNRAWLGHSPMQPLFIHSSHGRVKNYVSWKISTASTYSQGYAFIATCLVHSIVSKVLLQSKYMFLYLLLLHSPKSLLPFCGGKLDCCAPDESVLFVIQLILQKHVCSLFPVFPRYLS